MIQKTLPIYIDIIQRCLESNNPQSYDLLSLACSGLHHLSENPDIKRVDDIRKTNIIEQLIISLSISSREDIQKVILQIICNSPSDSHWLEFNEFITLLYSFISSEKHLTEVCDITSYIAEGDGGPQTLFNVEKQYHLLKPSLSLSMLFASLNKLSRYIIALLFSLWLVIPPPRSYVYLCLIFCVV